MSNVARINPILRAKVIEDFGPWIKSGMIIELNRTIKYITINQKKAIPLNQFELSYGKISDAEQLATTILWHFRMIDVWHKTIKPKLFDSKNNLVIGVSINDLSIENVPEEYIVGHFKWWGFEIHNNILSIRTAKILTI